MRHISLYCVCKQSRSCQLTFCASHFHLLVSSLFVLSNVIVEDVVGLYTCTRQSCIIQLFSVVVCIKSIVYQQVVTL